MTARQLATLIVDALEAGDYQYVEALALAALEDANEGEEHDADEADA